ncbi:T9SS type A sorting domain-containing protein [Portibacter lacus]|uniref:Secretion system C-terminal sorting domain-containing protein n=1 Tax=Portibacter lacus TaxID=1099794 RepID=A0AA37SSJ0_9BACT|nr:T9SS type A sorting domain-containing protein [Portibacter lacus]GLR19643.1 hypothetical protein GCM10007940_42590 [Portibacter lacus]
MSQIKIYISLFLLVPIFCFSQVIDKEQLIYKQINCEIPIQKVLKPKSIPYEFKDVNNKRALNYSINFIADGTVLGGLNCSEWPAAAKTALEYAMSVWSDALENTQNIGIDACWTVDVGGNTLAQAGAFYVYASGYGGVGGTYFPTALIEHIADQPVSGVDIQSFFNANRTDWYYGLDANTPFNKIDFVSVSIHELGHGLGFSGFHNIDDGVLDGNMNHECDGTSGNGCIGLLREGSYVPSMYDRFVDIDNETKITSLANPSVAIATNITGGSTTGGSGGLEFDGTNENVARAPGIQLHTPASYTPGSSYSHFDETTLPNELMSPSFTFGQAVHDPGMAQVVMEEMGWSSVIVPVELTEFSVQQNKDQVLLNWSTASEINNDYFSIEKSTDNKEFYVIGKVNGNGTNSSLKEYDFVDRQPVQGENYYRLKQIDFNGDFEYSDVKVVDFERNHRDVKVVPNPVSDILTVHFGKKSRQNDTDVLIYTMNGKFIKMVSVDYDQASKQINIQDLASGNYYLKIVDGQNVMTKNFVKMD